MSTNASTTLSSLSDDIAAAVEKASASVVTVYARRRMPGSGIVWVPGLIVTASHVVERDEEISVGLPDGSIVPATLVGRDPGSDIALLKVESDALVPATLTEAEIKPGHLVLAIGRPHDSSPMASFGIVSTTEGSLKRFGRRGGGAHRHPGPHGRRGPGGRGGFGPGRGFGRGRGHGPWADIGPGIESFIRAEVAMLPGFSGGPLVTANGEVAGLNTSALGRFGGITLPLDLIDSVVESLQTHGRVRRGYLGIGAQSVKLPESQAALAGQEHGLLIVNVEPEGPAGTAGLLVGDILVSVSETPVATVDELQETLSSDVVDTAVPVVVLRGGALTTITVKVGDRA
jgi:S1-C subfamily serine protease